MIGNPNSEVHWSRRNPKLAAWIAENEMCKQYGIKPKDLFDDLEKTLFLMMWKREVDLYIKKKNEA